ncbi:MAG: hypothetical protein AAFX99_18905 [Myxococcota bacterium]
MTSTTYPWTLTAGLVSVALLTGCPVEPYLDEVNLFAQTQAPPAATALLISNSLNERYTLDLSEGVALAATCWATCEDNCNQTTINVAPPDLLDVRPAYSPTNNSYNPSNTWVLIGQTKGSGTLTITTSCASRSYIVTVDAAPVIEPQM